MIEAFTRVAMHWRADRARTQGSGTAFDMIGEIELGKRAFYAWADWVLA